MRLHHLTLTAFGPFAGTERVDFDELNEAGLFLLTGPTGAGKSSLLDAVCFALYGTVPGARGTKTLKSQHSAAGARPEVVLDVSVQGRRFVVRRTPEWSRPKKRGDGLLTEKASASITETTGGAEHFLSARAAEVGLLVSELMGMSSTQFMQVALLPQGEFQTFLRASSQDRHDVLQHLFRTDRFSRIEDWVNEHSRELRDRAGTGRTEVQRVLDTVADRVGLDLPDDLTGDALAPAAAEGRVLPWVAGLLEDSRTHATRCRLDDDRARTSLTALRERHQASARRADSRTRVEQARRTLADLGQTEDAERSARARLQADDRADRCRPLLALRRQAAVERDTTAEDRDRALTALREATAAPFPPGHDSGSRDAVWTELETARARAARLRAVLPREQAAAMARREGDAARSLLQDAEREQAVRAARVEQLPVELAARSAELATASSRAARREALALAVDAARDQHRSAVALEALQDELAALDAVRRDARDHLQDARQHAQELMARRLAGMAAELAGALADGVPCQVCGGLEHPRPASPAEDAVTVEDQEEAERSLSECAAELDAAEQSLQRLQGHRATLSATAGGQTPAAAGSRVDRLVADLVDASAAGDEQLELEDRIRSLRTEQDALGRRELAAAARTAALRQAVTGHERTLATAQEEITDALGDLSSHGTVAAAVAFLDRSLSRLESAHRAVGAFTEASARLEALTGQADTLAHELGFPSLSDTEDAMLESADRDRLHAMLADRSDARTRAVAVLDEHAPVATDDQDDDLEVLGATVSTGEEVAVAAARRRALADERVRALGQQLDRLADAVTAWAPIRDEALRAESMARLVRGMGHDNQLQMRLSAYVLATRLDQVVAAANERLGHMRDQRYLLQRTGRAERKASQAGLGLEIVDQWTGDVRAPTTLSGGETFVVSLSLALGLADVVTQESGGTEVETLFVDEGFGTLDADTLDDVMDRLDGLRAGGRTVGVVSHVTEMRSRIPTQVQIDKGRSGSVISVRTLVR